MLAYSDGSQFGFTAEVHSTWLVRCGGYPTAPDDVTLTGCESGGYHQHPPRQSVVESWSNMYNVEHPPYPTPPLAIGSWELKWYVWCGGHTLPTLYQPSAVDSWSDMCNEEDPQVTCAMRRTHLPYPPLAIGSWELKWHVWCGGHTLPHPLPLAISSWELKEHVQWGGSTLPYPTLAIGSWEFKWYVQCGGPTLPYPPSAILMLVHIVIKTLYCSAVLLRPRWFG